MNKRERKFLEGKLLELVENDIISRDQMVYANEYFEKYRKSKRSIITILSSIGILLIALSVITLFAINWSNISKGVKVCVSFLPLVITAVLMFYYYKKEDRKLGLYTSIVAPISILATNSLITQVFHIQTEIYEMFFYSLLMFLPIAFKLRNYLSLLVYGVGTIIYSCGVIDAGDAETMMLVNSFILALPLVVYNVINYLFNRESSKNILMWTINATLITLFVFSRMWLRPEVLFIYAYLIYLITKTLFKKDNGFNRFLSGLFVFWVMISCIGSYMVSYVPEITFSWDTLIVTLIAAGFFYLSKVYKEPKEYFILIFIGMIQYTQMPEEVVFIFINILTILFGVYKIVLGNKESSYKEVRQGITVILLLIAFRFMNADLGFAEKSVIFLIAGTAFLIGANILKKRIGGNNDEQD